MSSPKSKFRLVGLVTSEKFQKCRFYIQQLTASFPTLYDRVDIRPMLNVQFNEYLTKIRRRLGGKSWELQNVVVFLNGRVLGDDRDVFKYMVTKGKFSALQDFHQMSLCHLHELLGQIIMSGRKLAYLTISVEKHVLGSILIMLYSDYVPKMSQHFLRRCMRHENGWRDSPIKRIVKSCWIQCGGLQVKPRKLHCENYVVPHDRRGVVSMANSSKHVDNSTQFIISLNPTPWMDYKYVAFGQVIHGDEVIGKLETIPTYYECPSVEITVSSCGEYSFEQPLQATAISRLADLMKVSHPMKDVVHPDDVSSDVPDRFIPEKYCLATDLQQDKPFLRALEEYLKGLHAGVPCEGVSDDDDLFRYVHPKPLLQDNSYDSRFISNLEYSLYSMISNLNKIEEKKEKKFKPISEEVLQKIIELTGDFSNNSNNHDTVSRMFSAV